jgi:hypothetical protein
MLSVEIDKSKGIVIFEPNGPLSKDDFETAAKAVDPYIAETGKLKGLVIHTKTFPGWDSFAALLSHLRFVNQHHAKISRVALSTDSVIAGFAEVVARHFVSAEIKVFSFQDSENAKNWATGMRVSPP